MIVYVPQSEYTQTCSCGNLGPFDETLLSFLRMGVGRTLTQTCPSCGEEVTFVEGESNAEG